MSNTKMHYDEPDIVAGARIAMTSVLENLFATEAEILCFSAIVDCSHDPISITIRGTFRRCSWSAVPQEFSAKFQMHQIPGEQVYSPVADVVCPFMIDSVPIGLKFRSTGLSWPHCYPVPVINQT